MFVSVQYPGLLYASDLWHVIVSSVQPILMLLSRSAEHCDRCFSSLYWCNF